MNYTKDFADTLKDNLQTISAVNARDFFFNYGYSSSSFSMPEYYVPSGFNGMSLEEYANNVPKITKTLDILTAKSSFAWRTFNFFHPYIYWHLINEITKEENWAAIKALLTQVSLVHSYSVPVFSLDFDETTQSSAINNWLQMAEKNLIKDSVDYGHLIITDIKNFYPSIYTHSIAWAIHGKAEMKADALRWDKNLLGNRLDKLFQNSRDGQTNGIPVGSMISDFVAEIILSNIDVKLSSKILELNLKDKVLIARYRDDYRILSKAPEEGRQVLNALNRLLNLDYDLQINSDKTESYSDIVEGSFRPWMLEIRNSYLLRGVYYDDFLSTPSNKNYLKDCLLEIYKVQKKFPNARVASSVLSKLVFGINEPANSTIFKLRSSDIPELVSLLRKLTLLREEITPQAFILFDTLLGYLDSTEEKIKILNHIKTTITGKADQDYQMVWFYRLCLSQQPDMCDALLSENSIPLLRVVSKSYYRHDYEIFSASGISFDDSLSLQQFSFVSAPMHEQLRGVKISPDILSLKRY